MSGGSMEYLYRRVEDVYFNQYSAERAAFAAHLRKVARALKAIEWNDSGDGDSAESDAIRACLPESAVLHESIARATAAMESLRTEIERASKRREGR